MSSRIGIATVAMAAAVLGRPDSGACQTPLDGLWRTASGAGVIELYGCGTDLCGRLADSKGLKLNPDLKDDDNPDPTLRDRPLRGMDILHGFKGGPRVWTHGRIYNPNNGKTYVGQLKVLAPDRIKVSGCVVYPLCGSQVWRRTAQ